jgi:hypothetical protein
MKKKMIKKKTSRNAAAAPRTLIEHLQGSGKAQAPIRGQGKFGIVAGKSGSAVTARSTTEVS